MHFLFIIFINSVLFYIQAQREATKIVNSFNEHFLRHNFTAPALRLNLFYKFSDLNIYIVRYYNTSKFKPSSITTREHKKRFLIFPRFLTNSLSCKPSQKMLRNNRFILSKSVVYD